MRSDWTRDARYLVADTGPYGGPHGHEDKLSFELSAYGAQFIVDPGSYTYSRNDPLRNYFVGSQGHNTVLVDGGSQVRRWNPDCMTPAVADVAHGAWRSTSEIDVASGHYDEGYAPFSMSRPQNAVISRDVTHLRDFVFVKPDYWVLVDYLTTSDDHDYTFLFHLAPDVVVEDMTESSAMVRSPNGARLVIKAVSDRHMDGEVIDGWYSEDHHKKCESPVLSFTTRGNGPTLVAWILYPVAADFEMVTVEASMTTEGEQSAIVVSRGQRSDRIQFSAIADAPSGPHKSRLEEISIRQLG